MQRRDFLILGSLLGLTPYLKAETPSDFEKEFDSVVDTLSAVQAHMFPEKSLLPDATSMKMTTFLFETISHPAYDRDIKAFVLEGAKELQKREKGKFVSMTEEEKEKALRAYEETSYGSNWLSRMMTLSMEALFSDPIYGSNVKEAGWKAVSSYGGFPRPKTKYIGA
ncbi:MAG: gluconate 2-dehydrogenase subunit 3 family protein [Sulfurovum sp.]|nr:gluconate 2-dehydrogenase subunit 3 family protein [Sulfurovum sp.]